LKNPFYEVEQVRRGWGEAWLCNEATAAELQSSLASGLHAPSINPPNPLDLLKPPPRQVIKCHLFDSAVDAAVKRYPLMLLTQPAGQGAQLLAAGALGGP
jgi:hypothetical protein